MTGIEIVSWWNCIRRSPSRELNPWSTIEFVLSLFASFGFPKMCYFPFEFKSDKDIHMAGRDTTREQFKRPLDKFENDLADECQPNFAFTSAAP